MSGDDGKRPGLFARFRGAQRRAELRVLGADGRWVSLDPDAGTIKVGRERWPIGEVAVALDEPGGSRITATRVVMLGVFALAARKRDTPYLSVHRGNVVVDVPLHGHGLPAARRIVRTVDDMQQGITRFGR